MLTRRFKVHLYWQVILSEVMDGALLLIVTYSCYI